MSGFPTRPSRNAFGPLVLTDRYPVEDPTRECGAATFDLIFYVLSGVAATCPLAVALVTFTGPSTVTLTSHRETWDPNSGLAGPTVARTGTGVYTVTYAATYSDKDGNTVDTALTYAKSFVQGTTALFSVASISSNRIATVKIFDAAGAATDASFAVEVF